MPGIIGADYCLSTEDVAKRMGVRPMTVWRWITNWLEDRPTPWRLPAVRVGRVFRISEDDLHDLLRRTNPKLCREMAEADQAEKKNGKREAEKLRERLN